MFSIIEQNLYSTTICLGKKYYNNLRNQQQQISRNLICRFIEVTTTFKHTGKDNNKAKQKMSLLLILLSIFL